MKRNNFLKRWQRTQSLTKSNSRARSSRSSQAVVRSAIECLEERCLLSATAFGGGTEDPNAVQAPDLIAFAQALNDAGVEFFGANFCEFCTIQKELFEDGAQFLPFIEVTNTDRSLNQTGIDNNISVFPTWDFPDGTRLTGLQSLETLSETSGVAIPMSAAPCVLPLPDVNLLAGSPLVVALDGYDPNGGPLTYTVTSDNPSVVPTLFTGNRSVRFNVLGHGDMVFELFETRAERPASRVIELAESDFYDGLTFHRILNNFVIQGGDPNGNGTGGSNLGNFSDQFDIDLQHNATGLLSYAKTTDDTNNSQFFVTEGPSRHLDFNHSIFGKLVEGEANRDAISNVQANGSGVPTFPVVIETAEVFTDTENATVLLNATSGSGTANITVTVTDQDGNSFQEVFVATLGVDTINGGPFYGEFPELTATAGVPLVIPLPLLDVEGDQVQLGGQLIADGNGVVNYTAQFLPGGNLQVTPNLGFVGEIQVLVSLQPSTPSNTTDPTDSEVLTINVLPAVLPEVEISVTDASGSEDGDSASVTVTRTNAEVAIFRDGFDGTTLDTTIWDLPTAGTTVGRTQFRTDAPTVANGVAQFSLDTFNPNDAGNTFLGTQLTSDATFSVEDGLVFETRARLVDDQNNLVRGIVGSQFLRGVNGGVRDEIDIDVLSSDAINDVDRIITNVFDDEDFAQPGDVESTAIIGFDPTQFNNFKIEWFSDRIEWSVNDVLVRTETDTIPDASMNVQLNVFAPDSGFAEAFDANLQPTGVEANNTSFVYEVDFVELRRFLNNELTVELDFDGDASEEDDFNAVDGNAASIAESVIIPNGATSATVTLNPVNDVIAEGAENAVVQIESNNAYTIGASNAAIVTILDNDQGTIQIVETDEGTRPEENETDTFTVALANQPASNVVLNVSVLDTTTATVDQTTLTFGPGTFDQPQTVTVTGTNDDAADGDRATVVTISVDDANSDAAFANVPDATVQVTTVDDDEAVNISLGSNVTSVARVRDSEFQIEIDADEFFDESEDFDEIRSINITGSASNNIIDFSFLGPRSGNSALTIAATGGGGNDDITGGDFAESFAGEAGDDTIRIGADDTATGGAGNDVIMIDNESFASIDGGDGTDDRIRLRTADVLWNLETTGGTGVTNVERIEIDGSGRNVLTLNNAVVQAITDANNTLIVDGGSDDRINIRTGWTSGTDEMIDGNTFSVFTQDGNTLKVRQHLLQGSIGVQQMQMESNSGVSVQLSADLDLDQINIYDGNDAPVEAADVTLVGNTVGAVRGSVLFDPATRMFSFIKTGGPLVPDTYTLTIFSRPDSIVDLDDGILDGDGDGLEGGDFVTQFTITASGDRVISIPDFVRGPNQAVDMGEGGIPVSIDNADGLTSFAFTVNFDDTILDVTGATLPADIPNDWQIQVTSPAAGQLNVTASGTTPLTNAIDEIVLLQATVPSTASSNSSSQITLTNLLLNGGGIGVQGDSGVQNVSFIGDVDVSGSYSILDAISIARIAFNIDGGFDINGRIDPTILGDVTNDGTMNIVDAITTARKAFGLSAPTIPDIPPPESSGAAPTINSDPLPTLSELPAHAVEDEQQQLGAIPIVVFIAPDAFSTDDVVDLDAVDDSDADEIDTVFSISQNGTLELGL